MPTVQPADMHKTRKRLIGLGSLVLIIIVAIVGLVVLRSDDETPQLSEAEISAQIAIEEQYYPEDYVLARNAKDYFAVEGTINSYSADKLSLKLTSGEFLDLVVTSDVKVFMSKDYLTVTAAEIKDGQEASVNYVKETKEVVSIWVDFSK